MREFKVNVSSYSYSAIVKSGAVVPQKPSGRCFGACNLKIRIGLTGEDDGASKKR